MIILGVIYLVVKFVFVYDLKVRNDNFIWGKIGIDFVS